MTSASFSVKALKERFEDGDLDLSLSTLSEQNVPLKEMKQLKKIRSLDLSCNVLKSLPMELCTFTSLIKLDVSKNQLTSLPADIGQLTNLQSLDLLGNQLTTLPESFGELVSLRWLDVRDNPLSRPILEKAGDCLDDKQCKACALRVVKLMNYVHVEREKVRAAEETKRQQEEARLAEEARQEKRRLKLEEKERKRQQFLQRRQEAGESGEAMPDLIADTREDEVTKETVPVKRSKSGGSSIMCDIISAFIWLFMLSAVCAAALVAIYYHCESASTRADASSPCQSPLWQQIKSFIQKSILPFVQNLQIAVNSFLSTPKGTS